MKQTTDFRATSRLRVWIYTVFGVVASVIAAAILLSDAGLFSGDPTSPMSDQLASSDQSSGTIANDPGVVVRSRPFPPGVTASASTQVLTDDAHIVGSASDDGLVRVSVNGDQLIADAAHNGMPVTALAFSDDGNTVVSGGGDSELSVWDLRNPGTNLKLAGHEHPVTAVAVSASGTTLASAGQETRVLLWDSSSGQLKSALTGHTDFVTDVAFSGDTRIASSAADGKVLVWDLTGDSVRQVQFEMDSAVSKLSFDSAGSRVITGSDTGTVSIWNVATGREELRFNTHRTRISALALSDGGDLLATASTDNQVTVWNSDTGEQLGTAAGPDSYVASLVFDDAGNLLIGGSGGSLAQWNLE